MWQDMGGRNGHPYYQYQNGYQQCPQGCILGAVLWCIHGHEYDDGESCHQGEASHQCGNDAADGEGESQGEKSQQKNCRTGHAKLLLFRHGRINVASMDIVSIQSSR